jgi:Cytochrome c
MLRILVALAGLLLLGAAGTWCTSATPEAVKRGEKALTGHALNPAAWTARAYKNAWRRWDDKASRAPINYAQAFRERYGLHAPPYANGDYPMGLRAAPGLLGKGISTDCLLCHGGAIAGRSYVGLGNTALDIQALFEDLTAADGRSPRLPFTFCNVRGTSEAGAMSVYLFSWRQPDLKLRRQPLDLGLRDDLCEDVPAWWLLKKKKTMYHTGSGDARSVRSLMQFMLTPLNTASAFEREEPTMADIQAYILSLKPPAYPFAVDRTSAARGERLFKANCARCHGTYGEKWTYPNKVVPLNEIGTDPNRYLGVSDAFHEYYQRTWLAHEKPGWLADECAPRRSKGYQAPPLDGIWATAPYFHNGSAPTVYHVLNSACRPKVFTRSYRTDKDAYDPVKLGWQVQVLERGADPQLPAIERRRIYDTSQPGRSNAGHTYGDNLTDEERMAVIEYLKTI